VPGKRKRMIVCSNRSSPKHTQSLAVQVDGRLHEHVTNHGALFASLLDRVHVRELKYDNAVRRLGTAQAQGLVVAAGQVLAA
jgi:hypothetical protein